MEFFPDGTKIEDWFYELKEPDIRELGDCFDITEYGVRADGQLYTREIQELIDRASVEGGVIYVPAGTFYTGALFFGKGVHLYLAEGAILKGSDDVSDYPVQATRIEGENCVYLPALINADHCDGFTIFGKGIIDGNGQRAWKAFWQRRIWNPACTNKDEQRARLLFVSNSKNVTLSGVTLQNSQFWTSHFYKCEYVKICGCSFLSPFSPVKAPSTDAIDLDVCSDVLVKNCYMAVNDDSTVLKGGKGRDAHERPENGANERILIEDCRYGYCHGILTCGSESVHNKNILMRRIKVGKARNFLWLKMRPDTRQLYEYIEVSDAEIDDMNSLLCVHPWSQFAEKRDVIASSAHHISMKNIKAKTAIFLDVEKSPEYTLKNFRLEQMKLLLVEEGAGEALQESYFGDIELQHIAGGEKPTSMAGPD